jgi:hypothetical protein
MRISLRRLGVVAVTATLATGSTLVPAQASTNLYAGSAASWLTAQLTHGVMHNAQFDFDDYGLSLDAYFALKALGRPYAAASVLNNLDGDPEAYISFDGETFAGATAKLATAVEVQGRDPRTFGGVDLVTRLEQRVHTAADAQEGRATDGPGDDFSNEIGQTFVVRALSGAGSSLADEALAFLLKQQCTAGFFRENLTSSDSSFSCDGGTSTESAPSVDATALAVQALVSAQSDGVTGLDGDLTRAGDWLLTQQAANGSFTGNGTPNTNTTGLAAQALVLTGHPAQAEHAAAWVARRQVTVLVGQSSPKLAGEVGAIAYDAAALAAAKSDGVPVDQRDQWRRATTQAAVGVNAVKPLTVSGPTRYLHGGASATIRVAGLEPGEHFMARIGDVSTVRGVASATGHGAVSVPLPKRTRAFPLRVFGSSSVRAGQTWLRVLGPKTFTEALRRRPIRPGHTQRVTVTGLAPGEHARLLYRGHRIWSGTASSTGRVVRSFRVGSTVGFFRLTLHGQFADRLGTTRFRVVR